MAKLSTELAQEYPHLKIDHFCGGSVFLCNQLPLKKEYFFSLRATEPQHCQQLPEGTMVHISSRDVGDCWEVQSFSPKINPCAECPVIRSSTL